MTDIVDREKRSQMMSNIRSKNTRPEMKLRRALHARGFRYRLHDQTLPGSPDIVLPKYKVAIFVHGCFWHRHQGCPKAYNPKSNIDQWSTKFRSNVARDFRDTMLLRAAGWRVITVWECSLTDRQMPKVADWVSASITSSVSGQLEWPVPPSAAGANL